MRIEIHCTLSQSSTGASLFRVLFVSDSLESAYVRTGLCSLSPAPRLFSPTVGKSHTRLPRPGDEELRLPASPQPTTTHRLSLVHQAGHRSYFLNLFHLERFGRPWQVRRSWCAECSTIPLYSTTILHPFVEVEVYPTSSYTSSIFHFHHLDHLSCPHKEETARWQE